MLPRPTFRAFAHRGGAAESVENSLAAFRSAAALGFVHMETDVRPSRDGVAVLHHDATLDRTTDGQGPVRSLTWRELNRHRLANGATPLRLEELLEDLPDVHVTIDAKEDGSVPAIADAVRRARCGDRVCVTSFSPRRLHRLRRLLPKVESGAHPWEVARLRLQSRPALPRVSRVQVPPGAFGVRLADTRFLERAHALGLCVDVWTINDPHEMRRLIDLGVDGIMTDSPSLLRQVLGSPDPLTD